MNGQKTTTLQVNKETQELIRQYCFLHRIDIKRFIEKLTNEKLESFKERLNELRKIKI